MNNIPVYSNGEQNNGLFGYTDKASIQDTAITISARGTIGFSRIRTEPYVPIVRLISVVTTKDIDINFLNYVISALFEQGVGTSIKQLTVPMVSPKLVPLPPLSEQKRIVEEIEKIFGQIEVVKENQEELSKLKDGLKNKILDLAIQGKLVEQDLNDEPASVLLEKIKAEKAELVKQGKIKKDKQESYIYKGTDNRHYEKIGSEVRDINDEIPFEIPNNWSWCRFKDLFNIMSSKRVLQSDWKTEGIPFYRAREIAKL